MCEHLFLCRIVFFKLCCVMFVIVNQVSYVYLFVGFGPNLCRSAPAPAPHRHTLVFEPNQLAISIFPPSQFSSKKVITGFFYPSSARPPARPPATLCDTQVLTKKLRLEGELDLRSLAFRTPSQCSPRNEEACVGRRE